MNETSDLFYSNPSGKPDKYPNESGVSTRSSLTKVLREVKILRKERQNGGIEPQNVKTALSFASIPCDNTVTPLQ